MLEKLKKIITVKYFYPVIIENNTWTTVCYLGFLYSGKFNLKILKKIITVLFNRSISK